MKFLKATLAATVVTAFAMSAQAQDSSSYINVGVQSLELDTYSVVARYGYNFSEYFGVEAEGAIGVAGTEEQGVDVSNPYNLGGFFVARYPVSDSFDIFGRAGYEAVRIKGELNGVSESATFDGVALGGGVQYNFGEGNGIRLGYTAVLVEGTSADLVDLSYVRKF